MTTLQPLGKCGNSHNPTPIATPAAGIISEIGNIERFSNSDKLARFSGVAPVNFSSAGKGKDQRSRQGNRVLNAI